jgi:hypothetical protein
MSGRATIPVTALRDRTAIEDVQNTRIHPWRRK